MMIYRPSLMSSQSCGALQASFRANSGSWKKAKSKSRQMLELANEARWNGMIEIEGIKRLGTHYQLDQPPLVPILVDKHDQIENPSDRRV